MSKKKSIKHRNPAAVSARTRNSGGPMRNKKSKRQSGKNKKNAYLDDNY